MIFSLSNAGHNGQKKDEAPVHASLRVSLENAVLSEQSQSPRATCRVIPLREASRLDTCTARSRGVVAEGGRGEQGVMADWSWVYFGEDKNFLK